MGWRAYTNLSKDSLVSPLTARPLRVSMPRSTVITKHAAENAAHTDAVGSLFKVRKDNINSLVVEYLDVRFMR
jgi:hypothetical protein